MNSQRRETETASELLGMFAKFWEPGQVKTRLGKTIGDQNAASIYESFVLHLTSELGQSIRNLEVHFSPPESYPTFKEKIIGPWQLVEQTTGDLGQRMAKFFESALVARQHSRAVLIGTDSPWLTRSQIEEAFSKLQHSTVVLGPSEDGGYYLIGMNEFHPSTFDGIPWSSPDVLVRTIDTLEADRIDYDLLPIGYDVDEPADLKRFFGWLIEQKQKDRLTDELKKCVEAISALPQIRSPSQENQEL